jgi:beta-lactamase superfamily II metal-dependent hydrolase
MEINVLPMSLGDSLIVRFKGNDRYYHNIVLDSGTQKNYRNNLRSYLQRIKGRGEFIDLWVISHIHDDHIGGAMKYIDDVDGDIMPVECQYWIYNAPRRYKVETRRETEVSCAASIAQGDRLYEFLASKGCMSSHNFIAGDCIDLHGLKVTFLAPTLGCMSALHDKYKNGYVVDNTQETSEAVAASENDYSIKADVFNLNKFEEDTNVENGSSISLLIEHHERKFLWSADAYPSIVCSSLRNLGYSGDDPLVCDFVTMAHHGSRGNTNLEWTSLVKTSSYIVTGNGLNRYNLPNKESLVRILKSPFRDKRQKIIYYFPIDSPILRSMFDVDGDDVFDRFNFDICFAKQVYSCNE